MSPRVAKLISRSLLALAVVMIAVTGVVAFTTFHRAKLGQIVVVPAEQEAAVRDAARLLDDRCHGAVADQSLADAPYVYCDLEQRRARGETLTLSAGSPEALIILTVGLLWLGTGGLIASRQYRNLSGWVFQIIGFSLVSEVLAVSLVFSGVKVDPRSIPLGASALIGEYALIGIALLPLLWLLFPDGRPPTPRWRWAVRLYFAGLVLAVGATLLSPGPLNNHVDGGIVYMNPLGVPALAGVGGAITGLGVLTALIVAVATVFGVRGRFKRATGEERQQLRWLRFVTTIAAALLIFTFVIGLGIEILLGTDQGSAAPFFEASFALLAGTIAIGIPAAYLIAIFKHGLWDLDIVIKKAVQYTVLLIAMAVVAALFVIAIPVLVFGTGVDLWFGLVVLLAALLALAFTWIRGPASRLATRIVYGKRATPYEVLTEFSGRVGETYSAEDVLPRMASILGEGTGAERAVVWLLLGNEMRAEAVWPADLEMPAHLPEGAIEVIHQGELLGALSVVMSASDPMDPAKEKLITDLAAQAGLVLRNVRLIEELRNSRRRLVSAQDEERRKLERNLHDGAQQQLVALSVQLKLARSLVDRNPAKAGQMLDAVQGVAAEALEDLRNLARGIYPPLLADKGLGAALEAQARKAAIPTAVEAAGIGRYDQDVESAVYFCTLEALNNVAKYAEATKATVRISQANGHLTFAVIDDGRGFDASSTGYGTGLQGMADRLDAIGADLEVDSTPGHGTTVTGRVPLERGR